jgi:hypothetical protein
LVEDAIPCGEDLVQLPFDVTQGCQLGQGTFSKQLVVYGLCVWNGDLASLRKVGKGDDEEVGEGVDVAWDPQSGLIIRLLRLGR